MAIAQQTDMDFTPQSPLSTASSGTVPTPCEELTAMKTYIRRLQIICNEKEKTVSLLRLDHGHNESDTLYQLAWNEFQDVQGTLQQAVSDFGSLPHVPVAAVAEWYRLKTTGEYIKLYSNTVEKNRAVKQTLKILGYHFYVITPKNERPIKIVIKGFPKTADPEIIKADLEEGFQPDKVTQLVGRRTKQKLPVFLVTLPRSIENLRIFDLKTLAHLNITVDGYNGKGITQCFTCENFHHNSDNCFLKPRCLKCGEEHVTKDCPIKQRLDTKFCINCQVYGHMANWHGCPCFPKRPKGAAKTNRNTYTNLYNSFVRPNFSYAQVTNNTPRNNVQNNQQMAPRRPETSRQTEAVNIVPPIQNQTQIAPPIINSIILLLL
ncbi:nucleic-acid-binding protein from transposon X-element [Trichonephila clavipes]|nr:nucleic-acid-binding protein from transposon X-element [Trichonephila clavipes]